MATRLLYAEDEDSTRAIVADQLVQAGYEVDMAVDGQEAIEKLQSGTYNLVLLDIKMPRKDGIEVLKFLKEKKMKPRVVMLTAVEDLSIAISCVKLGAIDYVTKPFSLDALLECVSRVLAK